MKKSKAGIIWYQTFLSCDHVSRDKRTVPLKIRMPKDFFYCDELDINVFFIYCAINISLQFICSVTENTAWRSKPYSLQKHKIDVPEE
jgi:hypothetical protein